jgi:hypothetical protein
VNAVETRLQLDARQAKFIADRVRELERESPQTWRWQQEFVSAYGVLPLFLGWTETLGIQPDGHLVRWSTEHEYPGLLPIEAPVDCALVLVRAAQLYPVLEALLPQRPPEVPDCPTCAGCGRLPQLPDLVCECCGLGWVPRTLQDLAVTSRDGP